MTITREQVARCYTELERRLNLAADVLSEKEAHDMRADMAQALYGCLMTLAGNWPEVRAMCDREEEERGWF